VPTFSAFHVKHSRQKFLEKMLDFLKFLARGRQCESEVSNQWVVSTKKCVCYQQLSLLQTRPVNILARGRQCESEVSNQWVVSTKKCVCYQQLSLSQFFGAAAPIIVRKR
jgi:hypothetical protein